MSWIWCRKTHFREATCSCKEGGVGVITVETNWIPPNSPHSLNLVTDKIVFSNDFSLEWVDLMHQSAFNSSSRQRKRRTKPHFLVHCLRAAVVLIAAVSHHLCVLSQWFLASHSIARCVLLLVCFGLVRLDFTFAGLKLGIISRRHSCGLRLSLVTELRSRNRA